MYFLQQKKKTKIYIKSISCDMFFFFFFVHYALELTLPSIILILQYLRYFLWELKHFTLTSVWPNFNHRHDVVRWRVHCILNNIWWSCNVINYSHSVNTFQTMKCIRHCILRCEGVFFSCCVQLLTSKAYHIKLLN